MDKPFLILVAAYGRQMRGILGSKLKIWAELPDEENKFWLKVVQNAGKYGGKSPVAYRMSTEVEKRDAEEYVEERMLTPDEVLEQEELAKEAHRVVTSFLGSLDAETAEADYSKQSGRDHF